MAELKIERTFNASKDLVWKAWSDSETFMKWWGPQYFTSPTCKMDFKQGGKFVWCMQAPDGSKFYSSGEFKEISPKDKIVYTDSFADENGNEISAAVYGLSPDYPNQTLVTVTFEEVDGKTHMTLVHQGIPAEEINGNTASGWNQSFDKLEVAIQE